MICEVNNGLVYYYQINKVEFSELDKWLIEFFKTSFERYKSHDKILVSTVGLNNRISLVIGREKSDQMYFKINYKGLAINKFLVKDPNYTDCKSEFIQALVVMKKKVKELSR